jgi:DNA-binding NarL/FixJ family response regulator
MIRVILVEDRALACDGVRRLLEEAADVRVVAALADGTAAVRSLARRALDVALLAVAAGGDGGIDLARRIRAVSPRTAILILCQDARAEAVRQALWAGASGYLLREAASDELLAAVRAVHAGRRYISMRIAPTALGHFAPDPLERLSARDGGAEARCRGQHQRRGGGAARSFAQEHRYLSQPPHDEARSPPPRRARQVRHSPRTHEPLT